MNEKKKKLLNGFMFLFYFIYQVLCVYFISVLNINLNNNFIKSTYLIITSIIYLIIIVLVYKKELYKDIRNFNIKSILKYIPIYLIGILLMGLSNIILSKITGLETSQNEVLVRKTIKLLPIYMSFSTVIYAPIVEEITFRKTFRNIIKNNVLFIILSGIMFGIVHISVSNNQINDLLMIIPYIIMGIDLAYIYCKSKNIFTTIIIHSIHNLILLIIQFMGG